MPEGDTVYRAARRLDAALSGQVLSESDFRVPSLATLDLSGQTVHATVSRGKHLLTRIGEVTVHTHLRMDGAWVTRSPRATHETRIVLRTESAVAMAHSVLVDVVPTAAEDTLVGHLGPDLLGPDWDAETALANLLHDPDAPLAVALLDQRNLAGIGNVFANELCFLAGLDPHTPIAAVPDPRRIVARAKLLLEANKDRGRRIITGRTREPYWVYGRRTCLRCATRLLRDDLGREGQERVTWWCPSCQPTWPGR